MPVGQVRRLPGGEAGREKVMLLPPPVMTKSSMASAWTVRGRVKAERRRVSVKRALRIADSLRVILWIKTFVGSGCARLGEESSGRFGPMRGLRLLPPGRRYGVY